MATLILRADTGQEQQHIPCHLHALSVLREARAQKMEWIRVEKPGHHCDFMVAALIEQARQNPAGTPKCLTSLTRADQEPFGTSYERRTIVWPGAAFRGDRLV